MGALRLTKLPQDIQQSDGWHLKFYRKIGETTDYSFGKDCGFWFDDDTFKSKSQESTLEVKEKIAGFEQI